MEESFDFTTDSKTQKIHYRSIPTPTKIRDQLFGDQYMSLEAALNRTLTHHENTILKPILNGNKCTVGQFSPAIDFGEMIATARNNGSLSSAIRAFSAGGFNPTTQNDIDYMENTIKQLISRKCTVLDHSSHKHGVRNVSAN